MTLALDNATVIAGGRRILERVSLACAPGQVSAIVGPNGAGKSTTIGLLAGERPPHEGVAMLDGKPLAMYTAAELARRRAVLVQSPAAALPMRACDLVRLGRAPFHDGPQESAAIVAGALAFVDAGTFAARSLPTLSGGERQRVHLARALAQIWGWREPSAPRYLLLDEPTNALDLKHQARILELARDVARQGAGVVAVLHDLAAAWRYADTVCVLFEGRVAAQGPTRTTLTRTLVERIFEVDAEVAATALGVPSLSVGNALSAAAAGL